MAKPTFSLPVIMDARTTKRLLDDEVNRYGGLIWDGTIVAASDPTLAQQVRDDVAQSAANAQQSAADAQQSAADAALYDGPRFDTVTDFFSSTSTQTAGTIVRTDAEGFAYRAVDTATATTVANAGGQAFEFITDTPNGVIANALSTTHDEATLNRAITLLGQTTILGGLANAPNLLTAYNGFVCGGPVDTTPPDFANTHYDFRGMALEATHNGVLFEFNPNIDWSSIVAKRDYTIHGGSFENTNATKTASEAFRLYGLRNFTLKDAFVKGFHKAINLQGKDSYNIRDTYFRLNKHDIYCPSGLVESGGDVLLSLNVEGCNIENGVASDGPVQILDRLINFWWMKNSINGAPAAVAQIVHFNNVDPLIGKSSRSIKIENSHFEQIGQYGSIDLRGNNAPIENVEISGNTFQQVFANAARLIRLHNVKGARIENNRIETQNGTVFGIDLDVDCEDIHIGLSNTWDGTFAAKIRLNGCPRDQVTIGEGKRYFDPEALTGFDANTWSTSTGNLTVDSLWSNYSDLWLYPKGYIVRLVASDSGSAGGTASALIHDGNKAAGTGSIKSGIKVDLSGTPNGTEKMVDGFVTSNDIGQLKYDFIATGAGTLTVSVIILAVVQ